MLNSRPAPLTALRRTTLVTAPLLLAAGCKWTEGGTESVPEPSEPAVDADDGLVEEALVAIGQAAVVVDRVSQRHIGLSTPLAGLTNLHLEHATVLEGELDDAAPRGNVPSRPRQALSRVVKDETALQTTLVDLAGRAASGSLASTLASMAAAVAQQLVVLKQTEVGGGNP